MEKVDSYVDEILTDNHAWGDHLSTRNSVTSLYIRSLPHDQTIEVSSEVIELILWVTR